MQKPQLLFIGILTILITVAIGILSGVVSLPPIVKDAAWSLIALCVLALILLEVWKQYPTFSPSGRIIVAYFAFFAGVATIILFLTWHASFQSSIEASTVQPSMSPTIPLAPTPSIPRLKSYYTGTRSFHPENVTENMIFRVISEDLQGNLVVSMNYNGSNADVPNVSCTGAITVQRLITLHCQFAGPSGEGNNSFTFRGQLYPDSHIQATETFPDGSNNDDTLK